MQSNSKIANIKRALCIPKYLVRLIYGAYNVRRRRRRRHREDHAVKFFVRLKASAIA